MNSKPQLTQDFFIRHILSLMGRNLDPTETFQLVLDDLHQARANRTLDGILKQMITYIGLPELLPPEYARFKPLLVEGMHFLLSRLPMERLAWKMVDQLHLAPGVSKGLRICVLIKDMPTLQKLGQVIGRNPKLDPSFKSALVSLEDNVNSITYADVQPYIEDQIHSTAAPGDLEVEKRILSEASVCAVIPAKLNSEWCGSNCAVVLKMVKPTVRQNLPAELGMLDRLAVFFDRNKEKWKLGDLKFRDTFDRVRWMIKNEADLTAEQANLARAREYYRNYKNITVPNRFSCSTRRMTVMSRLDGRKIIDVAHLNAGQKRKLASLLTDICIVKPLQDLRSETIFHGDPHAGNIAYRFNGSQPQILLYDWGMMGRLNRLERYALGLIAVGILTYTPQTIIFAVDLVTSKISPIRSSSGRDCYEAVARILRQYHGQHMRGLLSTVEEILEALACLGLSFPPDFLLFAKAMITLQGVLHDIDDTFCRDEYVMQAVLREFYFSIGSLKLQWFLLKETWLLYRYGFEWLLEFHQFILNTGMSFGFVRGSAAVFSPA